MRANTCVLMIAVVILSFSTACSSCSDGAGGEGGIGVVDLPTIVVNPEQITFNLVAIGETDARDLVILNVGVGDLKITDFTLRGEQSFSTDFDNGALPLTLSQGESAVVGVFFTPTSTDMVTGSIVIESNDRENNGGRVTVPLQTQALQPIISVFPSVIDFGRVPPPETKVQPVTIQNIGSTDLIIGNIMPIGSADFSMTTAVGDFIGETHPLAPGGTIDVEVMYAPTSEGFDQGQLAINSNDPVNENLLVPIRANGSEPCITVTHEDGYDFGGHQVGEVVPEQFTITNCSDEVQGEVLVVSSIVFIPESSSPTFAFEGLPALPTEVPPGGTANFIVTFTPTAEQTEVGILEIISNDSYKSPLEIEIRGLGSNNPCPIAVGECRVQGVLGPFSNEVSAIPLQTLECKGDGSSDSNGSIAQYRWTVVERPGGSSANFIPPGVANPTFFLDLVGRFVFELSVVDNGGLVQCGDPARVTVIVTADEDIHIQLVWHTPEDPNETDTGVSTGSDVDLHLLHPNGGWESTQWDCHFRARLPNWGDPGRGDDDPSLDIDDTDGAGPENINLSNPQDGTTYRIGVHYWDDWGFGTAYATVRVYIFGILQFEALDRALTNDQFWDVTTLSWPTAEFIRIDRITPNIP